MLKHNLRDLRDRSRPVVRFTHPTGSGAVASTAGERCRGPNTVLFAGGGSGGHVFPAIAIAEELRRQCPGIRLAFAGTGREGEREYIANAGIEYVAIRSHPLPRRMGSVLPFIARQWTGYVQMRRWLKSRPVAAVIGLGGYGSVPTVRACLSAGLPLVLVEPNAVPGRATRWFARRSAIVCSGFAQTGAVLGRRTDVRCTGTPVRHPILALRDGRLGGEAEASQAFDGLASGRKTLLIVGGSQGARSLNAAVLSSLKSLTDFADPWQILHLSGAADEAAVRSAYAALPFRCHVAAFCGEMERAYAAADLAVCRGGAATLSELAVVGIPAIVLPYPHAADDHQTANALALAAAGGAVVVKDVPAGSQRADDLTTALRPLLADDARRHEMARRMRQIGQPEAAASIAEQVLAVAAIA